MTSLNSKYFRQDLEDCLSLGRTLLIEDIFEELDPVLDNVLEKNYVKVGTSLKVCLRLFLVILMNILRIVLYPFSRKNVSNRKN